MPDLKLNKFDQVGIVVKDIEKAVKLYQALFNFKGPIKIVEQDATVTYKGKEATFKMKKVMQHFGDKQLEIVQVMSATGPNLYSEFLAEGKEGLHHLGIYTKEANLLIKEFKDKFNINVAQIGKLGKLSFSYLDTKDYLGYYLELLEF